MRNNIEERFFEVFRIKPIATKYECRWGTGSTKHTVDTCKSQFCDKKYCNQKQVSVFYPQITSRILLELICIANAQGVYGYSDWGGCFPIGETIEELKESVLKDMINNKLIVHKQVQSLFKEEVEEE